MIDVVVVAVGEDLLDQSAFLAHFHLHSDPFAWQAPCIHHTVAEAAGLKPDLEIVVELVVEAVGLEADLELAELVVDQDVVEAIFEVVAAKEVGVRVAESVAVVEVLELGPVDDVG